MKTGPKFNPNKIIYYDDYVKVMISQNKHAIIDKHNYNKIKKYRWFAQKGGKTFYANATVNNGEKRFRIGMHNIILKSPAGGIADHIDRDGLNNTVKNLRIVSRSQNGINSGVVSRNTSGHTGVQWSKSGKCWVAVITVNKKHIHIGCYGKNKNDAIVARKKAEEELVWKEIRRR